ncbi:MAG: hypothetical protein Kow00121_03110 [Elainellaceae cyanobacterium]
MHTTNTRTQTDINRNNSLKGSNSADVTYGRVEDKKNSKGDRSDNASSMNTSMNALSRYWKICQISLAQERTGYEFRALPQAQQFLQTQFPSLSTSPSETIQTVLLSYFRSQNPATDAASRAQAGLCLRCNVSYPILKACQKIDNLFGGSKQFTYHDLLPFVLNDDGKTLLMLDSDGKTQIKLDRSGNTQPVTYKIFAVEVLRTFKSDPSSRMSLENWAFLQTKQHPELKTFLSEFGFQNLSDWALLNRVRPKQLEQLSEHDRHLVAAFHAVYRRDRLQQQRSVQKCPDPSSAQLQEMGVGLQQQQVCFNTPEELLKALKRVATQLRQYDIWSYREPLELANEDGSYVDRPDLPHESISEFDVEQKELLEFFQQQLQIALANAVNQEIDRCITKLKNSKKYAPFAPQFVPGLQLYYDQGMSLKEIVPVLGMTSWDQARRILNPGELLTAVRTSTVQQLLSQILAKAQEKGLTANPPHPDYLKTLSEQIEAYVDEEVFCEAAEEIRAGKNRSMDSVYAQQLRLYFAQHS